MSFIGLRRPCAMNKPHPPYNRQLHAARIVMARLPFRYKGLSFSRYTLAPMMELACTSLQGISRR